MLSKTSILLYVFLFTMPLWAQTSYEFDINYGFGASELSFNSVPGIALSIYPAKNFGFSAGLQYSWHWRTKTSELNGVNQVTADSEGDSLIFKYAIDNYEEKLSATILQIPILLKYSNDLYYVAAGIKFGVVQKINASISYGKLETEGYYPQYDLTLNSPIYQGFGTLKDSSFKTEITSKNLTMLALEGGVKLKLSDNFALLSGIFADYSFYKGFKRNLPPIIERVENKNSNGASIVASDSWKSWHPWSVGIAVKFSFLAKPKNIPKEEPPQAESLPVSVSPQEPFPFAQEQVDFHITNPPAFLLDREADFVFHYPESDVSPSDSLHTALLSQMANALREKNTAQLYCIGYSEKLLSESLAYETAFQRVLGIRFALTRFYGIEEKRIFIYSQGSNIEGYRRAECFIIER